MRTKLKRENPLWKRIGEKLETIKPGVKTDDKMLNYTVSVWCNLDLATGYMCKNFLNVPSLLNNCLPALFLSTQQTTQGRQHLQIEHSQDTPKQVQDK